MSKGLENLTIIREYSHNLSLVGYLEVNHACDDIEKELQRLEAIDNANPMKNFLDARRNGKALEQMYQLVNYSKAPMKPSLWIANIDGKIEQRVIMEKEDYDTKSKKELALDIAKEKNVDLGMVDFFNNVEDYNEWLTLQPNESRKPLSEYEFGLIKQ